MRLWFNHSFTEFRGCNADILVWRIHAACHAVYKQKNATLFFAQFLDGAADGPVAFHYPETPAFGRWLDKQGGRA